MHISICMIYLVAWVLSSHPQHEFELPGCVFLHLGHGRNNDVSIRYFLPHVKIFLHSVLELPVHVLKNLKNPKCHTQTFICNPTQELRNSRTCITPLKSQHRVLCNMNTHTTKGRAQHKAIILSFGLDSFLKGSGGRTPLPSLRQGLNFKYSN